MCGLVVLRAEESRPDIGAMGLAALETLAHRGPDDQGWQITEGDGPSPPTFLGHRRLSILDLSAAGRQPMRCPVTGNLLVFNGEIYNFIELRRELEGHGCVFRTDSDSEVVLQAWRVWREEAFARFNGMWALVILDRTSGALICCRDRLGVKPLYYTRHRDAQGAWLMLASEIRAIATALGGYPPPERRSVFEFLVTGVSDHGCRTFYQGIAAIPPGWILHLTATGESHWERYHQWPEIDPEARLEPEAVKDLVTDAVRLRLRSDAPTVSLLSGGLDSSILTLQAARLARTEPRSCFAGAFTYGYSGPGMAAHDETESARAFLAAAAPDVHHVVHLADPVPDESELLALARDQEEPVATPSILASRRLYRAIRDAGFKVVLSGEGADEIFGGYVTRYMSLLARDRLLDGGWLSAWRLLRTRATRPGLVANRLAWHLPAATIRYLLRNLRPSVRVMNRDFWQSMATEFDELRDDHRLRLEARLHRDIAETNLPMILRFADRNSMRFGVEVRSPYLDWRLLATVLAAPVAERMGDDHGKAALRRAFAGDLPETIAWGRKRHGFGNAEQYLVPDFPVDTLWERLPSWAADWLSLRDLRRELARPGSHTTLWWSVSLLTWLAAMYGDPGTDAR